MCENVLQYLSHTALVAQYLCVFFTMKSVSLVRISFILVAVQCVCGEWTKSSTDSDSGDPHQFPVIDNALMQTFQTKRDRGVPQVVQNAVETLLGFVNDPNMNVNMAELLSYESLRGIPMATSIAAIKDMESTDMRTQAEAAVSILTAYFQSMGGGSIEDIMQSAGISAMAIEDSLKSLYKQFKKYGIHMSKKKKDGFEYLLAKFWQNESEAHKQYILGMAMIMNGATRIELTTKLRRLDKRTILNNFLYNAAALAKRKIDGSDKSASWTVIGHLLEQLNHIY